MANGDHGKQALEEEKDKERHGEDERNCKLDLSNTGVHAKAIVAHSGKEGRRSDAADAEEGGENKNRAVARNNLQLLGQRNSGQGVFTCKGEQVLSSAFADGDEGAGE